MTTKSAIESILLITGEPVTAERLQKILKKSEAEIEAALTEIEADYRERGIRLSAAHGNYQFVTAPENSGVIEELVKSEFTESLSKAALDTLSVIAYKGPMTRSQVEYIRGVNSSFTIRNLLLRGLVERIENPKDARSYLYRVSLDFLHYLGLEKVSDLPEWEPYHKSSIPGPDERPNEAPDHESQ